MMKQIEKLTPEDQALLFKAPALVSVLASCSRNEVDRQKQADAIRLAHLKTYTADPLLQPYYKEVEKHFKEQFETLVQQNAPFDEAHRQALIDEIHRVNQVISKLDPFYAKKLHHSLENYAHHVKMASFSVFQDFLFPMPIPGLSA
ncbi:hypothetical protein V9K67_14595 [Paraflavisolibacter sp. H34]|uniref:hypothetical protein n=1 Tax=Huijunlia imazamoxiresistens TaxID=3127457 RepID=UPI003017E052